MLYATFLSCQISTLWTLCPSVTVVYTQWKLTFLGDLPQWETLTWPSKGDFRGKSLIRYTKSRWEAGAKELTFSLNSSMYHLLPSAPSSWRKWMQLNQIELTWGSWIEEIIVQTHWANHVHEIDPIINLKAISLLKCTSWETWFDRH